MSDSFACSTATATICVFDLAALKHRLNDDADWWSAPDDEIVELNAGSVVFIKLGTDGRFEIEASFDCEVDGPQTKSALIRCPSGQLFIGPAEQTTSDGMEPDKSHGGRLFTLEPQNYRVSVTRTSVDSLRIVIVPTTDEPKNQLTNLLRVESFDAGLPEVYGLKVVGGVAIGFGVGFGFLLLQDAIYGIHRLDWWHDFHATTTIGCLVGFVVGLLWTWGSGNDAQSGATRDEKKVAQQFTFPLVRKLCLGTHRINGHLLARRPFINEAFPSGAWERVNGGLRMTFRLSCVALLLLFVGGPGCGSKPDPRPTTPEEIERFEQLIREPPFDKDDPRLWRRPAMAYQLKPAWLDETTWSDEKHFRGYEILKTEALDAQVLATTRGVLGDPDNFEFRASCFTPGLAFRFGEGAESVEIIICLDCSIYEVYEADHDDASGDALPDGMRRGLTDKGVAELTTLYNELFVGE